MNVRYNKLSGIVSVWRGQDSWDIIILFIIFMGLIKYVRTNNKATTTTMEKNHCLFQFRFAFSGIELNGEQNMYNII